MASAVESMPVVIDWLRVIYFVGLVIVFALGFQSGQRYG